MSRKPIEQVRAAAAELEKQTAEIRRKAGGRLPEAIEAILGLIS